MRFVSLDSIRGIAALSVVFAHLTAAFDIPIRVSDILSGSTWNDPRAFLILTPLRAFVNGRPAVILFFVLSGFVLSLPFSRGQSPHYWTYLIKRFFRIYVPFFAAIVLSALLLSSVQYGPVPGLSDWFNTKSWNEVPTVSLVLRHLAITGLARDMTLDNVMWSLVHEIRISLIFPLIAVLVLRRPWVSVVVFPCVWVLSSIWLANTESETVISSFLQTGGYTIFFALGAFLAFNLNSVLRIILFSKRIPKQAYAALAFFIFSLPAGIIAVELLYGVSSMIFIALAIGNEPTRRVLEFRFFEWLGNISFSLYLIHLPILLLVFRSFYGFYPWYILCLMTIIFSLAAAFIGYVFVERPAIFVGSKLAAALKGLFVLKTAP